MSGGRRNGEHEQCAVSVRKARFGYRIGDGALEDMMIADGLAVRIEMSRWAPMATTSPAEEGVAREEQDAWALRSHQRAIAAQDAGRHGEEIVPVEIQDRKGTTHSSTRRAPRRDTSAEALAKSQSPPSPRRNRHRRQCARRQRRRGRVGRDVRRMGGRTRPCTACDDRRPRARRRGDPRISRTHRQWPAEIALKKAGITVADLTLVEINEAFANVALITSRRLGVSDEIVNVNGGAVALGHPIGASGARIVLSLVLELRRRGGGYGLAAICSGGGQGDAIVVKVMPMTPGGSSRLNGVTPTNRG